MSFVIPSIDVCRFCHIQHSDLRENSHGLGEKSLEPWTEEEYDTLAKTLVEETDEDAPIGDISEITTDNLFNEYDEPESENESFSSSDDDEETVANPSHGLKSICVFNQLQAFHSVSSMPPDCLHDLFEAQMIKILISKLVTPPPLFFKLA